LIFGNIYIQIKSKMAEKQNLVEEALIQMKSLENVVAENAKGILASTMKQEISELVKESLKTEEDSDLEDITMEVDEQLDTDIEDVEDEDSDDNEMDDDMADDLEDIEGMDDTEDMDDMSADDEFDFTSMDMDDEEPIDLTMASDEEILKVFKAMGEEDGIIVKKDGDTIDLEDANEDVEYKISLGESEDDFDVELDIEESDDDDDSEVMFEIEMDDDMEDFEEISMDDEDEDEEFEINFDNLENLGSFDDEESEEEFEFNEGWNENADIEKSETKEGFKPKGMGMGKPKFEYKEGKKMETKEGSMTMKPKGMGMGKPKFEYKEGKKMEMKKTVKQDGETSEASRTLGNGKRWGRNGLDKPKAAPRHLKVENVEKELVTLRERNEEYRKALNIFRSKLNEVAVFNSNLAYATRLFTEHSTTKNEKINILRRFDSIESLKESKSLYKTIKDELSTQGSATVVKESLQEKMERNPSSGSAVNLIESKTYENPQFLRMKDLMSKMNIIK
jgi:HIV Tat-specific factor 1